MSEKIAFVATGYIPKYDGISVYTENLLLEFLQLSARESRDWHIDIYVGVQVEELIRQRVLQHLQSQQLSCRLLSVRDENFFVKMAHLYWALLKNGRYDVVFTTNFMPLTGIPTRMLKVIHDLSPETNPHLYSRFHRFYHAMLLRSGKWFDDAIGYISRTTLHDLEHYYAIAPQTKQLVYLPNGVPFKVRNFQRPDPETFRQKFRHKKLNMLVVGRLNRAKGIDRIVAFCHYLDRYLQENPFFEEVVLHFSGKQTSETHALFENAKFRHVEIVFDGFLDDEALNQLYKEANFCIFLSRNEGYGLPLVEALWFGAVPVLSDIPIFREIMKEEYPLFAEREGIEEEILAFMLRFYQDEAFCQQTKAYLENILNFETQGYRHAAENLIEYIDKVK